MSYSLLLMLPPPLEIWITDSTDWRVGILMLRIYVSSMHIDTFTDLVIALNTHLIEPIQNNRTDLRINDMMEAVENLFPFNGMVNLPVDLRERNVDHAHQVLYTIQLPQLTVARVVNGDMVEFHLQDEILPNYVTDLFPVTN